MSWWRKWTLVVILSTCKQTDATGRIASSSPLPPVSCVGLTCVSAAGSLISFFLQDYIKANKGYQDITNLITVPTLSMVSLDPTSSASSTFTDLVASVGHR